jgi:hypothetical protein
MANMLFIYMNPDKQVLRDESNEYCLYMFLCAITAIVMVFG